MIPISRYFLDLIISPGVSISAPVSSKILLVVMSGSAFLLSLCGIFPIYLYVCCLLKRFCHIIRCGKGRLCRDSHKMLPQHVTWRMPSTFFIIWYIHNYIMRWQRFGKNTNKCWEAAKTIYGRWSLRYLMCISFLSHFFGSYCFPRAFIIRSGADCFACFDSCWRLKYFFN